jgi:hypothetical protein
MTSLYHAPQAAQTVRARRQPISPEKPGILSLSQELSISQNAGFGELPDEKAIIWACVKVLGTNGLTTGIGPEKLASVRFSNLTVTMEVDR